jgi:hypothetical protein
VWAPQIASVGKPTAISQPLSKVIVHNSKHNSNQDQTNDLGGKVLHMDYIGISLLPLNGPVSPVVLSVKYSLRRALHPLGAVGIRGLG